MVEVAGSEFTLQADLILLAMGFVGPRKAGMLDQSGVELDARGNVKADTQHYRTSDEQILACGDMRRGQSPGRLGDPRRPPVRPLGGRGADGIQPNCRADA